MPREMFHVKQRRRALRCGAWESASRDRRRCGSSHSRRVPSRRAHADPLQTGTRGDRAIPESSVSASGDRRHWGRARSHDDLQWRSSASAQLSIQGAMPSLSARSRLHRRSPWAAGHAHLARRSCARASLARERGGKSCSVGWLGSIFPLRWSERDFGLRSGGAGRKVTPPASPATRGVSPHGARTDARGPGQLPLGGHPCAAAIRAAARIPPDCLQ